MSNLKKLLLKEAKSDVTFSLVDENNEKQLQFPAHKIILRLSSSIFNELFTKDDEQNKELILQNVTPNAFKDFLKFIYEDEIGVKSNDEIIQLLELAQKYEVNSLIDKCVGHLTNSLNIDTFLSIFPFTKLLKGSGKTKLLHKCLLILDEHAETIFKKKEFVNAELWVVEEILDRDSLNIEEIDVFKAVVLWAHFECCKRQLPTTNDNLRLVLDRLFYKIRFLAMSTTELTEGPLLSGLFTTLERDSFLKYKRDKAFVLKDPWILSVLARERFMVNSDWVNLFGSGNKYETCRQEDVLCVVFSRNVILTKLTFMVNVEWSESVVVRGCVLDLEKNLVRRWRIQQTVESRQMSKPKVQQVEIELDVAMDALKCYMVKAKCLKGKLCNTKGESSCLTAAAVSWSSGGMGDDNVPLVNFQSNKDMCACKDAQYNMYWRNYFQRAKVTEENMDTAFQSVKYFILK